MRYHVFQNIIFLIQDIRKEHPMLLLLIAVQILLGVVSPVFGIYMPKLALDLVMNQADRKEIFAVLGSFGLMMALAMALSGMADLGKYMLYNDMRRYYQMKLYLQSLSCDYKNVESEEGQTKYQRAMATLWCGDGSGTSQMVVAAIDIAVSVLCFVIYSGILSTLSFTVIFLLVILSLISLAATRHAQNYEYQKQDEAAIYNRKLSYVTGTGSDVQFGKDMRLYQIGQWFLNLRDTLIGQSGKLTAKIQNRYFGAGIVNAVVLMLRDGISYSYLIYAVISHEITVSEFTLYFGAITSFSGFVSGIVRNLNELNGANLKMNSMREFLNNTDEPDPEFPVELSQIQDMSMEFRDVSFSYQPDGKPVLDHFNLKINSGEKVALVGVNGAGKTTIIKLLCGFYRPDSGEILIGGKDIRNFRKEDLLTLFSAVFQELYIPPFTVAENVAMRQSGSLNRSRVQECLTRAGLWEQISQCEAGIDTPMTREIGEGLVLSGGQQQKLLMARALYKDAPILILDEPTAALDPIAESQTYQQFHEIARDKTAIYISHRLASTRFCDKIAFLKDGKITEEGTHEKLLQKGGDYCRMFTVQSSYYESPPPNRRHEFRDAKCTCQTFLGSDALCGQVHEGYDQNDREGEEDEQ